MSQREASTTFGLHAAREQLEYSPPKAQLLLRCGRSFFNLEAVMSACRRIVLAARPVSAPTLDNFRIETAPIPAPAGGELLVRTLYLSLDPYMRGRMSVAASYAQPTAIGDTMEGEVVAEVIQSRSSDYLEGDLVRAKVGWCTHATIRPEDARRVQVGSVPITAHLGVLGMPGFTAYVGMKVIGQPKHGETLAVSAAAGPVGSLVGQLAKLAGARAIGIAGGAAKCHFLVRTLGFDAAVDRHTEDFARALQDVCPEGIDIYFENTGGAIWPAVLPQLNRYARVPVCGLVAFCNGVQQAGRDSWPETMLAVLRRSLLIRGFINSEFASEHYGQFLREIEPLVKNGRIRYREHIVDGLDAAPSAFIGMLEGRNFGKLLVKVANA
jgi:NADPH-dependent curcumin reductase